MRSRTLAVLLAGLLLFSGGSVALAQPDEDPVKIRGVEVDGYPTVSVTVSVPPGVSPGDLRLTENGSTAEVLDVRLHASSAIDIVLAIDTSDSVRGAALAGAVSAARDFVNTLPEGVAVGIVTFGDRARVAIPLTNDHPAVLRTLDSIDETTSGTALYDALTLASGMFSDSAQRNVVLLTDGVDIGSSGGPEDATRALEAAEVTVFSVGLQGNRRTNFSILESMSERSGGGFVLAETGDLSVLYQDLAETLANQYVIRYRSRAPQGADATVTVQTLAGRDSSTVLIPTLGKKGPFNIGERLLLRGGWGLLLALGLTFLAAFLLLTMLLGAQARARRDRTLAKRMAAGGWHGTTPSSEQGAPAWIPEAFTDAAEAVAEAAGIKDWLARQLERAGMALRPGEIMAASIGAAVVGLFLGAVPFGNLLIGLVLAGVGGAVPFLWVRRGATQRIDLLGSQLPDVLMILASSMRAGHSFLQALDTVAKEIGEPSGPEFARVVAEIRLGRPFEDAMTALAERVGTDEFKWAVLGVNVQREVGGNLAEILDTLAQTIRERAAVRRQIQVLSAEGRLSVKILIAMPFLLALYLTWINGEYMRLLWTTRPGLIFLVTGSILMVVGAFWARKVVRINV